MLLVLPGGGCGQPAPLLDQPACKIQREVRMGRRGGRRLVDKRALGRVNEFDLELTSRQWPGLVVVDELQSDGSALLPCSELTFFDFPCHVRMPPFARQLAPHQPTDQDGRRRHLRPGPVQHCEGSAVCRSCMCDECQETICPAVHCSAHEVGRGGCFDQCVHAAKEKRCMPGAAVAPADVAARPPACLRAHVWQGSPMGKPSAASRRTSLPTGA